VSNETESLCRRLQEETARWLKRLLNGRGRIIIKKENKKSRPDRTMDKKFFLMKVYARKEAQIREFPPILGRVLKSTKGS